MRSILVSVAFALVLSACPSAPEPAPGVSPSMRPERGGTLRVVAAEDIDALDPHVAARPASWFFARAIHRGLYAFGDRHEGLAVPAPDIALALPTLSDDGRALTIKLRGDARFAAPVSRLVRARDVRASIERIVRAGVGIAPSLSVIVGAPAFRARRASTITGISAPDATTIVLRLSAPTPELTSILAQPQLAIVPAGTPSAGRASPLSIVGAGPYRIATYQPESSLKLVRNPDWRASSDPIRRAYVDKIEATFGVSPDRAADDVGSSRSDLLLDAGPPDDEFPAARGRATLASASAGCLRYLFLNLAAPPFKHLSVRRAIAASIDRGRLPALDGAPATSILAPTIVGNGAPLAVKPFSAPPRARSASAILTIADLPRDRAEAAEVTRAAARAGVALRVVRVPAATLYPSFYERGRAQAGIATWCPDWPGLSGANVLGALTGAGPANYSGLPTSGAITRARAATADRAPGLWRAADLAVQRTCALIPLSWPSEHVLLGARVHGWVGSGAWPRGDPTALWLASA